MSIAQWVSAFAPLGSASLAGASLYAIYRIVVTGLQSMSQPGLPHDDRRLIGRTMLIVVGGVILFAGALTVLQHGLD